MCRLTISWAMSICLLKMAYANTYWQYEGIYTTLNKKYVSFLGPSLSDFQNKSHAQKHIHNDTLLRLDFFREMR